MKSFIAKDPGDKREWVLVDAKNKVLGRLAAQIADMLRGKDKPTYTPHVSVGSFVVVINAEKVKLTGKKEQQKIYRRYSGWPGGLKDTSVSEMRKRHPDRMILLAVRGMLPKNHMSRTLLGRLKIYAGESHPHAAQNPKVAQAN